MEMKTPNINIKSKSKFNKNYNRISLTL